MEISGDLAKVKESEAVINALRTRIKKVVDKVPAWQASSYEGYPTGGDQTGTGELEIKGLSLEINGKTLIIACKSPPTWTAGFTGLETWPKGIMAVVQDKSGLRPATDQDLTAAETVLGGLAGPGQTG